MLFLPTLFLLSALRADDSIPAGLVYTVDNAHSVLDFTVRLVGFNRVRGSFKDYSADIYYVEGDPLKSSVSFNAQVASIDTDNDERDGDLMNPAFFDQKRFPSMRFTSQRVEQTAAGFMLVGPLTIRDSTHVVRIPFTISGKPETDPFGNQRVVFYAEVSLNRKDYGVKGPAFWEKAISDSVHIEMELAGRRWNWPGLGFGGSGKRSAGQILWAAADSGKLPAAIRRIQTVWQGPRTDTTYSFAPWAFVVAANRRASAGRAGEGMQILRAANQILADTLPSSDQSELLGWLGEVSLIAGKPQDASQALDRAVALNPGNTFALEWQRHARE
jgi:polyisoprenoid-binding protein YceI